MADSQRCRITDGLVLFVVILGMKSTMALNATVFKKKGLEDNVLSRTPDFMG
jgi:hypothetical protein